MANMIGTVQVIFSMFSRDEDDKRNQEDTALGFKGLMLEKRLKKYLKNIFNIDAKRLYVKDTSENIIEREMDLAFVLDGTLFLFECKAFNHPYTVREHAKTNKKIKEAIKQLERNANYFEEHLSVTLNQLCVDENTQIEEVQKVLFTSTTLGVAGEQESVLVIDEVAFIEFILRCLDRDNIVKNSHGCKITAKGLSVFFRRQSSIKEMQKSIVKTLDPGRKVDYICCKKNSERFMKYSEKYGIYSRELLKLVT